ncbi:MAG: hypothetical protein AAF662_02295 [Pseudomonadota bacterium]
MANDIEALRGFADALARSPVVATNAAAKALNAGAEEAERLGRDSILSEFNLERAYVERNLFVKDEAKRTDLLSRIRANNRSVLAPRFGAEVATEPATSARNRLRGDPSRNIPLGRKAAGSKPWSMKRDGRAVPWRNAFFLRLRTSGAWAMAVRQGSGENWGRNGDLRVISGISVGQAWRANRDDIAPQALKVANRVFAQELERNL